MGDTFAGIVASGPLLLGVAVAALAGLVSFFAPCMLPLVPGYLSYVTGLAGTDLAPAAGRELAPGSGDTVRPGGAVAVAVRVRRGRAPAGSALFVLGFTAVFVTVSYTFGALGRTLRPGWAAPGGSAGGPGPGWPARRCWVRCSRCPGPRACHPP